MRSPDRTEVTNAAAALRDMYALHCTRLTVPGDVVRRPVLSVPQGPSTHGGLLARQHITLEPQSAGTMSITVGWVDVASRQATLRTFPCLLAAHRARFGSEVFGVDGVGYERFLHQTRTFLVDQGIAIDMEHSPPEVGAAKERSSRPWLWTVLAALLAVALVVAWLLLP
jgi:hypothetical protein